MNPLLTATDNYPQLSDRIQSTFIDLVLIIVLMFISGAIMDRFEQVPDWVRATIFIALFVAYEPICTSLGCTVGNYIKGIRVRSVENPARRINIFQAIIRYIVKVLLGWLSFLTIHSNPQKRAIHDLVSGSIVIKVD